MRTPLALLGLVGLLTAVVVACADGSEVETGEQPVIADPEDGGSVRIPSPPGPDASTTTDGGGTVTITSGSCPAGLFVTNVKPTGIDCTPFADLALAAMRSSCRVYLGWRDSCDGCTLPPSNWGSARTNACENGGGVNGSCGTAVLGTQNVSLYGLNTGGDVNDDDKFYASLYCDAVDPTPSNGPCAPGTIASEIENGLVKRCVPAASLALGYVRQSCSLYTGWRDSCSGCVDAPTRWGRASSTSCTNGLGITNSCTVATLGTTSVQLFGINTGGDVDDDDKFHFGLKCDAASAAETTVAGACPAGQLVAGIAADGKAICKSPDAQALTTFRDRCGVYYGWRDGCQSCTLPPTKWGRVTEGGCTNALGVNGSCVPTTLLNGSVNLYGMNVDGDVDENDRFYVGFHCE